MRHLKLNLPDSIDLSDHEIVMTLAARLYENGKLSLGQAAELAGLSKSTFAELLGKYNVSLFNFPVSDLESDLRNAE